MRFKEGVSEKANTKPQNALKNLVQPLELLARGSTRVPRRLMVSSPICPHKAFQTAQACQTQQGTCKSPCYLEKPNRDIILGMHTSVKPKEHSVGFWALQFPSRET